MSTTPSAVTIAIIGGTGFGHALVPGAPFTQATDYGDAALSRADLGEGRTLIFAARHGAGHSLPPHLINHRANIAALRDLSSPPLPSARSRKPSPPATRSF